MKPALMTFGALGLALALALAGATPAAAQNLTITDVSVTEGNAGSTNAGFSVNLSAASAGNVTVRYATSNGSAAVSTSVQSNSTSMTIPASGTATPYFTDIVVPSIGAVSRVTVTLTNLSHTFPDDIDALLVGPLGQNVMLMSDAGGGTDVLNINLTFDDTAAAGMTTSGAIGGSGTFRPSNFGADTSMVAPAPAQPYGTALTVFNGLDPAGTWRLYVRDEFSPDGGSIAGGWSLTFSTDTGDYLATNGTLTFLAGETTKNVDVTVVGDTNSEFDENFTVTLSSPTGSPLPVITDATGVGTIGNDDAPPPPMGQLVISDASVTEGNAGATLATFSVTMPEVQLANVTVNYATSNGTADSGPTLSNFTAMTVTSVGANAAVPYPSDINVPSAIGAVAKVTVNIGGLTHTWPGDLDLLLVGPAGQNVMLMSDAGAGVDATNLSITFDDAAATLLPGTLTSGTFRPTNNGATDPMNAPAPVGPYGTTLAAFNGQDPVGNWSLYLMDDNNADGGAINNGWSITFTTDEGDYVATAGTLTFTPGETSKTFDVTVNGDVDFEADETYTVTLSGVTGAATINDGTGVGTIGNDDAAPPAISLGDGSVTEGDSGRVNIAFTATLDVAPTTAVTVEYNTADGTAVNSYDYKLSSGVVSFAVGETTRTFNVGVWGDLRDEIDETFTVNLSNPTAATITDGQGIGTINDDDLPPSLSIADASVTEGDSGFVNANFVVTLSQKSGFTVSSNWTTTPGTATASADYRTQSGTLTFAPGEASRTISVRVWGELANEVDETFNVTLSGEVNATIADGGAVGTIGDNDGQPAISIAPVSVTEGDTGYVVANFPVTLTAPSFETISVNYATGVIAGSATPGVDYRVSSGTVTFVPGQTSKLISVRVWGDLTAEALEAFTTSLSSPVNGTIGSADADCSITSNE